MTKFPQGAATDEGRISPVDGEVWNSLSSAAGFGDFIYTCMDEAHFIVGPNIFLYGKLFEQADFSKALGLQTSKGSSLSCQALNRKPRVGLRLSGVHAQKMG